MHLSTDNGCIAIELDDIRDLARHFAQWGAEHLADARKMIKPKKKEGRTDCSPQGEVPNDSLATQSYEKIPNDLEEAAEVYFENPKNSWQVKDVFISGAKWQKQHDAELIEIAYNDGITIGMTKQKEQMMKEAVEGRVISNDIISSTVSNEIRRLKLMEGDKVRIIIIKDEGK